jgi:hypothetical protein
MMSSHSIDLVDGISLTQVTGARDTDRNQAARLATGGA